MSRARGVKAQVPPPTRLVASETAGQRHCYERTNRPEEPRDHRMITGEVTRGLAPAQPKERRRFRQEWPITRADIFAADEEWIPPSFPQETPLHPPIGAW